MTVAAELRAHSLRYSHDEQLFVTVTCDHDLERSTVARA